MTCFNFNYLSDRSILFAMNVWNTSITCHFATPERAKSQPFVKYYMYHCFPFKNYCSLDIVVLGFSS